MTSAAKPSKKALKKQVRSKASFTSPFSAKWSPLLPKDKDFILRTLKDKIIATGLKKEEVKMPHQWRKKKENKPDVAAEPVPQASEEAQGPNPTRNGWKDTAARRQLAIGINEVTKALERNQLRLLLVCKSVRPQLMTNHLIALSATRGVPACQVPHLSESVAELLGLKSVLSLGFRRCSSEDQEMFRDTVDAIIPRVPSLEVDWLTDEAAAVPAELTADLEEEEEGEEQMEEGKEEEGGRRAQKRKLEIESEITDSALSCTLRPLKVKRIVPNPDKKRKTKLKKQK
ncbi:ribonuclease P protein subunit p38-like [Xiphophorus couchianus]|uniref:ribonuclease P protein subunit p38-like n=1 Tax=Xiphophorus couchianus TaxID=32473 RepID=UPI0010162F19|nr:ribonuclease P protein subunit p38-like [Xiphophorus couchianus]XP_027865970.1 ribonuclease P protein subunit p38-like [Xiphophorus couchianus]XP_027865982.1 ribonuclease P protein subunit p38-like [Xiphophorus couchianus]